MNKKITIVLLGGTGFVGSCILKKISTLNPEIVVNALVRNQEKAHNFTHNIVPYIGEINKLPQGLLPDTPHVIIHFATKQIDYDKTGFEKVNIEGTKELLKHINKNTIGILYGSSMSVYGAEAQINVEEKELTMPQTTLAKTRIAAEKIILNAAAKNNIWGITLRPRFIVGKGDKYIIPSLLKLRKKRIRFISGNPNYSIISVDDYADIIMKLVNIMVNQSSVSLQKSLNISYKNPIGLQDIFEKFELPSPYFTFPLNGKLLDFLSLFNNKKINHLSYKIKLIGLPHYANVDAAIQLLGTKPFTKDPRQIIQDIKRYYIK